MPPALPPRDPARTPAAPQPEPPRPSALLAEIALLRQTVSRLDDELGGLRRAMGSRALIDQAKGAVRALTGASDDEAFALLSARSQHQNRKLVSVAADLLAAVDASPERHRAVAAALGHAHSPGGGQAARPVGHATRPTAQPGAPREPVDTGSWQPRRRFDRTATAVRDPRQLRAVADLAEQLCAATSRADVVDVLVGHGAAALGAFAGSVAARDGAGHAVTEREAAEVGFDVEVQGADLTGAPRRQIPLDAADPVAETMRTGSLLVLTRADLALRYPSRPRPRRLQGVVVLPLAADTAHAGAWELYYDHQLPTDRGTGAMLEWAARLASVALCRAP